MSRIVSEALDPAAAAVVASSPLQVFEYARGGITMYLQGTFDATVQAQISGDEGLTYHDEGAAQTTPGAIEITKTCTHVRWNTTVFASGVPLGFVCSNRPEE